MNTRAIRFIAVLILIITMITGISYGQENNIPANKDTKVVMVIINRIDFRDLEGMPYVNRLIESSAIALMNNRGSGSNSEFKSYATLGWGVRSEATHNTSLFYNLDEETKSIYERRTGNIGYVDGIINLNIGRLINQNRAGEYGAVPGALGQVLRDHGYKTAVLGNADTDDTVLTQAALVAMDYNGYIDFGDVGSDLIEEDLTRPFGIKTDYDLLLNKFEEAYLNSNLIVIETGDTIRLERYKENLYPEVYEAHKTNILNEIDGFIADIVEIGDADNMKLIITSPYPSSAAITKGERLTPLVIYEGENKGQVLYSSTTRRDGIIGNVDIGPTILSYFNLSSDEMTGRVLTSNDHQNNLNFIHSLNERVVNTSRQRARVLYSFAVYEIVTSILALILIIIRNKLPFKWHRYMSLALIGSMVAPFTLLLMPLFGVTNITVTYLLLIGISVAIVVLLKLLARNNPLNLVLYAMAFLVFGLLIDTVTGQNLIKNSLLGYDPIIGARYYGIGNEYMGILIGAVLILATIFIERYSVSKYIPILFFALVVVIIGFPKLGANVGGTITAAFTFIFVSIRILGKKINLKKLIFIGLAVVGVVATMAIVDLFFLESQSHLAGAINQIVTGGPVIIYQIIVRKISMNLRLMGVTVWSKVLLSAIVVLGALLYKPIGFIKRISLKYPKVAIGWTGIIVASVIGFAVNDSGIVAAATSVVFLTSTILYLIIDDLSH